MTKLSTPIVHIKPKYLDRASSAAYCALSESTLEKGVREDTFPKPRLLAALRVGRLVRELDEWAEARPVAARCARVAANAPCPPTT